MTTEQEKFFEWIQQRRKFLKLSWKQVYAKANVGKTTVTKMVRGVPTHINSRDKVAAVFGFDDWIDLRKAQKRGMAPDGTAGKRLSNAGGLPPARLAECLVGLLEKDAGAYRDQLFQNLQPATVVEIARVFNDRVAFYMKGKG